MEGVGLLFANSKVSPTIFPLFSTIFHTFYIRVKKMLLYVYCIRGSCFFHLDVEVHLYIGTNCWASQMSLSMFISLWCFSVYHLTLSTHFLGAKSNVRFLELINWPKVGLLEIGCPWIIVLTVKCFYNHAVCKNIPAVFILYHSSPSIVLSLVIIIMDLQGMYKKESKTHVTLLWSPPPFLPHAPSKVG